MWQNDICLDVFNHLKQFELLKFFLTVGDKDFEVIFSINRQMVLKFWKKNEVDDYGAFTIEMLQSRMDSL